MIGARTYLPCQPPAGCRTTDPSVPRSLHTGLSVLRPSFSPLKLSSWPLRRPQHVPCALSPCPLRGQDLSPPRPGLNPSAPSVPFVCLLKFKGATTMRSFSANPHPPLFFCCMFPSLPSLPSLPFAPFAPFASFASFSLHGGSRSTELLTRSGRICRCCTAPGDTGRRRTSIRCSRSRIVRRPARRPVQRSVRRPVRHLQSES